MRIVLDTNVLVAALLSPHGAPAAVLQLILSGGALVCFDTRVMSEYREVLRREKFGFDRELTDELLEFLKTEGELVASAPLDLAMPDPADAMFLEVGTAGGAHLDKHLIGRIGQRQVQRGWGNELPHIR